MFHILDKRVLLYNKEGLISLFGPLFHFIELHYIIYVIKYCNKKGLKMAKKLNEYVLMNINSPGGTASKNSVKYRSALPNTWMQEMGITQDNKIVDVLFNGKEIIIQAPTDLEYPGYEKNTSTISISGSGGGASKNTLRYNIFFLNRWMQQLEVTKESRTFKRSFIDGKIILEKAN